MRTVVTSFGPAGYALYGKRCVESFHAYWPSDVRLICYWEGEQPAECEGYDLLSLEPCRSFLERHKDNPVVAGKVEDPRWPWGPKARRKGYNFRLDAYKFARKVFAIAHAARQSHGKLFWLDADTVTRKAVPSALLDDLLPDDASLCFLQRDGYHSECGFVGYNLEQYGTRSFIAEFERLYAEDGFLKLKEFHDSFCFDHLVARLKPRIKLIPHTSRSQPFDHSSLGEFMVHRKGDRKLDPAA